MNKGKVPEGFLFKKYLENDDKDNDLILLSCIYRYDKIIWVMNHGQ